MSWDKNIIITGGMKHRIISFIIGNLIGTRTDLNSFNILLRIKMIMSINYKHIILFYEFVFLSRYYKQLTR